MKTTTKMKNPVEALRPLPKHKSNEDSKDITKHVYTNIKDKYYFAFTRASVAFIHDDTITEDTRIFHQEEPDPENARGMADGWVKHCLGEYLRTPEVKAHTLSVKMFNDLPRKWSYRADSDSIYVLFDVFRCDPTLLRTVLNTCYNYYGKVDVKAYPVKDGNPNSLHLRYKNWQAYVCGFYT